MLNTVPTSCFNSKLSLLRNNGKTYFVFPQKVTEKFFPPFIFFFFLAKLETVVPSAVVYIIRPLCCTHGNCRQYSTFFLISVSDRYIFPKASEMHQLPVIEPIQCEKGDDRLDGNRHTWLCFWSRAVAGLRSFRCKSCPNIL